jgi:hypothetical protein
MVRHPIVLSKAMKGKKNDDGDGNDEVIAMKSFLAR